jgi:hypothetical protein
LLRARVAAQRLAVHGEACRELSAKILRLPRSGVHRLVPCARFLPCSQVLVPDDLADLIDMLTIDDDMRRGVVRILGEIEATSQ